jgi:hypothetical protein
MEASVRWRVLFMHHPYIHVKGLRFRHSNTSAFTQQGAAVEISSHSTLEKVDVQYMDFAGIGFGYQRDNGRVLDSIANNNGSSGINAVTARNFLVRNVTMMYNNNRNFNSNWHAGGFKAATNAYGTVENSVVGFNKGPGIWFDHTRSGMPIIVRNNYVHDNGRGEGAIFFEVSNNGLFYNNVVARNRARGIYICHRGARRYRSRRHAPLRGNAVQQPDSEQHHQPRHQRLRPVLCQRALDRGKPEQLQPDLPGGSNRPAAGQRYLQQPGGMEGRDGTRCE